ncbi:MAG: hypothetical protein DHS20C18_27070 [Saprospiraceae bacterium]|nr:MAG: hypothetical protein DHS20C18_27070 [Saprospiraceae bacterium]
MVEDGLSSNDVMDLFQDEAGFMWIATEHGLNKFDGYTFKKHRYHPSDTTSIGANFINSICEDDQGNVWVNLSIGIISKYDKLTQKFTNYFFPDRNTYIYELCFIPGLGVSIATNYGWYTVDDETKQLALITPIKEDPPKKVYKTFPASNQRIYLKTSTGFELYSHASKTFVPTFFKSELDTIPINCAIEKGFEDANGVFWIQTYIGSLYKSIDGIYFEKSLPGTGPGSIKNPAQFFIFEDASHIKWYLSNAGKLLTYVNQFSPWTHFPQPPQAAAFAFKDQEESIWLCTKSNELLKWNGGAWVLIMDLSDHLNYGEITRVVVDDKNGIWLGSKGKGLWRIYNRKWPIHSVQNSDSDKPNNFEVTALLLENQEFMWMGARNNFYRYYFDTKALIPVINDPNQHNPFAFLRVNGIAKAKNGELWVATSQGLVIIDKGEKKYRHLKSVTIGHKKTYFGCVRHILSDQSGRLWMGTTNGLFLFDLKTDRFHYYTAGKEPGKSISSNNIQCMMQVSGSEFLIGYVKEGVDLLTFNRADQSISCRKVAYKNAQNYYCDLMTANTFYHTGTDYWVGTYSKGLVKLDLDSLTMRPLSETFPIIPNIKAIQQGTKGNLWISSIDGIRSVNTKDQTFYRFSKASGLLSNQFQRNCSVQDSFGNLYFGSSKGLNKIQPSDWNNQDTVATPILTGIRNYDQSYTFQMPLDEVETVHLSHRDDCIILEFVSPTYDNPNDVQYAYQLEGFDDNWRYCESQRSATYTNLAPGEYLFKARAGNKGGFLNSETKQLKIIVAPPFWHTSWFALLVIALLGLAIWVVYKIHWRIRMDRLMIATEVRKKAADDFHDELGHRLTKITLFAESLMLQKDAFPANSAHLLRKIQDNANGLYCSTRDFIWAMNPSKDSALELFIHLRDFGDELFADTAIQFSVEGIKEAHKDHCLDMDWKRQLVMIFKEAMTNALKHANCTTVVLNIEECDKDITITLVDNGNGFTLNHEKFGYGLGSMFNRSKKVGGQLEVITEPGRGTKVIFQTRAKQPKL